jgi:hypothetical protein
MCVSVCVCDVCVCVINQIGEWKSIVLRIKEQTHITINLHEVGGDGIEWEGSGLVVNKWQQSTSLQGTCA